MSTPRITLCLTFTMMAILASDVDAQSNSRRSRVRQGEQTARASWQPTRPSTVELADEDTSRRRTPTERVRHVEHLSVSGVPSPPPATSGSVSIVQGPVHGNTISHEIHSAPMDGQISLSPLHDGNCDALPGDVCGCGSCNTGGCDAGGCDSCSSGSCGGGSDCSCCGELCSSEAWRPCVTLCLPQDGWVSFEYLSWWQDGMTLPPLVTTSGDPNVARGQAGVLGSPTTQILFGGNNHTLDDSFDGGRLRFGVWLDRCHTWGVGAELFNIGQESEDFVLNSTGNPILARPFFNTLTGLEDSELVAFPNVVSGAVGVRATSELEGASINLRYLRCCNEGCSSWLFCGCAEHYCSRTEAMFGWRHLDLTESVQITENLVSTDTANPGSFDILDRFDTRNQFDGVDVGWMYRRTRGFWTFDSLLRLAVGNTRQTVTINGQTTINDPNNTPTVQTLPGGLLTQTSNIGTYKQDEFTVVPEFNANVGYQLTDHLRATLGYTFIYWSNVVRPGEHISRDLNPNLLPPPADPLVGAQRPGFEFDTTDYWVQGISFGGEYRW
ncbi:MAG: BBP7 family outer membrane beta-barrel protein [Rubripirellula sp.]